MGISTSIDYYILNQRGGSVPPLPPRYKYIRITNSGDVRITNSGMIRVTNATVPSNKKAA